MFGIWHPHYPLKGADTESPHIVKFPLPAGTRSDAYRSAILKHWLPAVEEYRPEKFSVSAGFDGHVEDPMSDMLPVDDDYVWLTQTIVKLAQSFAKEKIVSCLKGGYALNALGRCDCAHIRELAEI